ncbi:putative Zinc finger, RanBP2-type [Rosa chinensis]|uniref:Putative Zinc finger, RanBP2-type n=1 Tax=Rosa chinensis TaxID=74649 RepID=A0A2P6RWD4_ROSCH|nr:putative Zinc finger, RanBP2-type [Rosa chinensis]
MSRPGDWNCRSCQHLNFQRRDSCQRCGDVKSGGGGGLDFGAFNGGRLGGGGSSFGFGSATTGSDVRPGDWYCAAGNCGAHNFASRSSCFKCGAFKDEFAATGGGGGFDSEMTRSRGVSGWEMAGVVVVVVVVGLDGNLEIGFVPGSDATSITLLAEWNVLDAMPQETHTREKKFLIIQFLALLLSEKEK